MTSHLHRPVVSVSGMYVDRWEHCSWGTVGLVHLENWRDLVPILLARPRMILPDVLRILADNRLIFDNLNFRWE